MQEFIETKEKGKKMGYLWDSVKYETIEEVEKQKSFKKHISEIMEKYGNCVVTWSLVSLHGHVWYAPSFSYDV